MTQDNNKWFTLIEILVWILIFSIVIIWWFKAFWSITAWKVRLIQKTNIEKESIYFTEKLFEMIKKWWTIDYEEYFNRKVVWTNYASWHYQKETWFWNFWSGGSILAPTNFWDMFYYCRSWSWANMWINWCFNNNFNNYQSSLVWKFQRYWEYSFQFIDYNSNNNNDGWDEDWNWSIIWDDDDEYIWEGPSAFTWWTNTKEIYLISWNKKNRTLFRWTVKNDPNTPPWITCIFWNWESPTGSWCLWNIEFLQLEWKDWWFNHSKSGTWLFDWVIDTWIISNKFTWNSNIVAWSWGTYEKYWQPIFPDSINIKDFKVYFYPNKDIKLAWKEPLKISPYLRIVFKITPTWKHKIAMKWNFPEFNFSTTINLTDIFSK